MRLKIYADVSLGGIMQSVQRQRPLISALAEGSVHLRAFSLGIEVATLIYVCKALRDRWPWQLSLSSEPRATFLLPFEFIAAVIFIDVTVVAVMCFPFWWLIRKFGLTQWWASAGVGYIAAVAYWLNYPLFVGVEPTDIILTALAHGFVGAVAGAAVWWVDVGRSKRAAIAGNIAVVLVLIALAVATIRFIIEQSNALSP